MQFDPSFPTLIEGEITSVAVIDPVFPGNQVIDPTQPFDVKIQWKIFGTQVPIYLAGASPAWNVSVYGESIGSSPDILLGSVNVNKNTTATCGPGCTPYEATVTVPPGTLQEHVPGTAISGIYKIAVAVFLDSLIPGNDLIGFEEGPLIQAEAP